MIPPQAEKLLALGDNTEKPDPQQVRGEEEAKDSSGSPFRNAEPGSGTIRVW